MQIPNKFDPIALKDLMDFPYKENLFAYYYKGKFYLAPNRSYDELDTIPPGATIIVHSIYDMRTTLIFGDGIHKSISVVSYKYGPAVWRVQEYTGGGMITWRPTDISTFKNAIFGGGSDRYYYGYYPDNFNMGGGDGRSSNDKRKNYQQNVKFGCCFDRKLSKAEFDDVARWILRTQP